MSKPSRSRHQAGRPDRTDRPGAPSRCGELGRPGAASHPGAQGPSARSEGSAPIDLPCLRPDRDGLGCELRVLVQPNARQSAVAGMQAESLRVRLAAPPIEGRANAELQRWLADALGLPRRAVTLAAGSLSRHKRVHLDCTPERVATWLRQQGAEGGPVAD